MAKEYIRKLTKQKASFLLTIPKDVIIELSIREGDLIAIRLEDNRIVLSKARKDDKIVYTIGYAGKTLDNIFETMRKNKIKQLIDVRNTPFSMKNGFSKAPLETSLKENGFSYLHMPLLGAPKAIRLEIKKNGNRELFFKLYRNWLKKNSSELKKLTSVTANTRSILMCVEEDYRDCHRSVLGEELTNAGFEVMNL